MPESEKKRLMNPDVGMRNLPKSYFFLQVTNGLINSKRLLMDFYEVLAHQMNLKTKASKYELQPCGRKP